MKNVTTQNYTTMMMMIRYVLSVSVAGLNDTLIFGNSGVSGEGGGILLNELMKNCRKWCLAG